MHRMAAAHQINLITAFRRLLLRVLAPLLLLLFIARPGIALQAPPSTLHLAEPPAVNVLAAPNILERRTSDLSAGMRIHRAGRTLDVWMITPHSIHWDAVTLKPPLAQQLEAADWPPPRLNDPPRFERLPPRLLPVLRATPAKMTLLRR